MRKILFVMIFIALLTNSIIAQEASTISHGPMSGEITDTSVVLWARASNEGQVVFEVAQDETFTDIAAAVSIDVNENNDFIAETIIENLDANSDYVYRVRIDDSDYRQGSFTTAPHIEDEERV